MKTKTINVIGCGYIGLPTACMFASHGHQVVASDINQALIKTCQAGQLPFEEKGLTELFRAASNRLSFSTDYISTDIYIVTVPTPFNKESKKIDATYVKNAVQAILSVCLDQTIIIIESTISPKTIDEQIRPIIESSKFTCGVDIFIAHAPERIIPGNMIYELRHNDRTIGVDQREVGETVKALYQSFCQGEIHITDICSAEMSKVVENTYRDINIAFANELAKICHIAHLDVYEIIRCANMHPRVNILKPGPGVGGHCISVDPWFLVGDYPGLANIILTARNINDSMPAYVLERIYTIAKQNNIAMHRIGLYGLTYKEDVDDVRDSPTQQLLDTMQKHCATPFISYDPYVKKKIVENQIMDFEEFLSAIDFVVVMVAHQHIHLHQQQLAHLVVLDTKNALDLPNKEKL